MLQEIKTGSDLEYRWEKKNQQISLPLKNFPFVFIFTQSLETTFIKETLVIHREIK